MGSCRLWEDLKYIDAECSTIHQYHHHVHQPSRRVIVLCIYLSIIIIIISITFGGCYLQWSIDIDNISTSGEGSDANKTDISLSPLLILKGAAAAAQLRSLFFILLIFIFKLGSNLLVRGCQILSSNIILSFAIAFLIFMQQTHVLHDACICSFSPSSFSIAILTLITIYFCFFPFPDYQQQLQYVKRPKFLHIRN